MRRILLVLALLASSSRLEAQIVGQGSAGTEPWLVSSTPAGDTVVTGTITAAGQEVTILGSGLATLGINVERTGGSTTYVLEASADAAAGTWASLQVLDASDWQVKAASSSASASQWLANVAGWETIRLRYLSGTGSLSVTLRGNATSQLPLITSIAQGNGSTATGSTTLRPWAMHLYGSTANPPAEVQAGNLYVAPAIANAAAPTYAENDVAQTSIDLSGNTRITGTVNLNYDMIGTRFSTTLHEQSLQIGGAAAPGGDWHAVEVSSAQPTALAQGLIVRPVEVAIGTPAAPAPTWFNMMAGRDPVTNLVRQFDLKDSAPAGTENGVIVRNIPSGTQAVSGTISFSNTSIDITDRAARLLGVVYGSQGQQLQQSAVNFNLFSELRTGGTAYDARSIRALTSSDVVDVSDRAARLLGRVYGSQGQQLTQTGANFNLASELFVGATAIDPRAIRALVAADVVTAQQGGAPWSFNLTTLAGSTLAGPFDADSGAGTQNLQGVSLRKTASGGSVELGTSSDPVRTDPTGTTIQPVSGTVGTKTALTVNAPAAASVGVASAQALASNAGRKGLIAVNTSNATISCAVGASAVLNSGITLQPGAIWNMNEYSFATGAINCIASAAASNLSLEEFQ